jgi:hypothetical protein
MHFNYGYARDDDVRMRKSNTINCDDSFRAAVSLKKIHQYEQNEQSHLTLTH